jgi:hypothetical protein
MAKEYSFALGGQVRVFKYRREERRMLEARFGKGLKELIYEDCMPVDEKRRPTGGGKDEAQIALLWAGLKYGGGAVDETRVASWVDEYITSNPGNTILAPLAHAIGAIWASGILGTVLEMDFPEKKDPSPGEGEGGDSARSE